MATTVLKESTPLTQVIYSNVKEVVEQAQYLFDTLWKTTIPAEQKIKELEEGIKSDFIETIRDPYEIQKIAFDLIGQSKEEILVLFSSVNAFQRQKRAGTIELLMEVASFTWDKN
jgi:two-component system, OmpR family, sensor histidine kinase VicK